MREFMSWGYGAARDSRPSRRTVEQLRMCKEEDEVEKIVAAQRIAEQALEEVLNDIKVGVTEKGDRGTADLPHAALRAGEYVV